MTKKMTRCDRCGHAFDDGPRYKLALMAEKSKGAFSQCGFSRYYCNHCAGEVRRAVKVFEREAW